MSVLKIIGFYECSCGRKQSGGYLDGAAPDGVLGLGPGSISVPSLLAKAGLIRNSFSICLNEDDSGRILFGDQGHVTQQSTPFLPVNGDLYVLCIVLFCCCSISVVTSKHVPRLPGLSYIFIV